MHGNPNQPCRHAANHNKISLTKIHGYMTSCFLRLEFQIRIPMMRKTIISETSTKKENVRGSTHNIFLAFSQSNVKND
jgi:hypothetical protein